MQPYNRFQRLTSGLRRYVRLPRGPREDFRQRCYHVRVRLERVCGSSEAVVSRKVVIFLVVLVALALLSMLLFYFAQVFNTFSSLYHSPAGS